MAAVLILTMSHRDAFDNLGEIATAVLASGDEITSSFNDIYDSGDVGLYIQRNDTILQAKTTQGVRFVVLAYKFELSNELKSRFTRQQATTILPSEKFDQDDSDESLAKHAAVWQLDAIDSEEMDEAYSNAIETPNAEVSWENFYNEGPDSPVRDGFEISRRVYPSEDSFSVADYDQSARWLRHYGIKSARTLMNSLDIFDDDTEQLVSSSNLEADTPAFQ